MDKLAFPNGVRYREVPLYLLYFAWANQRRRQCYIRHTAQFTWRRAQYSTARDNGESFSLSYTGKQGR